MSLESMQKAVENYVNIDGAMYQQTLQKYTTKQTIDKGDSDAIASLAGQHGIFAKTDIESGVCIGQYYGDQYLVSEYDALYKPYQEIE
eukprot:399576_1